MKPTFINVGPGRCGTSWLHQAFRSHPDIAMASIKETEFFNTNFEKGNSWYEAKFPSTTYGAIGEISNNYYLDPVVARRISQYDPSIRIIFNLRRPLSLLKSMYGFAERRGLSMSGGREDLEIPIGRIMGSGYESRYKSGELVGTDTPTLFEAALLSRFINQYVDTFPADKVHFFLLERMKSDPAAELSALYRFLEVDDTFIPPSSSDRINDALIPQSKVVARAASSAAFTLRRLGADRLLTALHDSTAIKNVLFKKRESSEVNLPISKADHQVLLDEEQRICDLVPGVRGFWP